MKLADSLLQMCPFITWALIRKFTILLEREKHRKKISLYTEYIQLQGRTLTIKWLD